MADIGVLVGWSHQDWGDKLVLDLETVEEVKGTVTPDVFHVFMTKNQAAVLANYLFEASGRLPPDGGQRSVFKRLLG